MPKPSLDKIRVNLTLSQQAVELLKGRAAAAGTSASAYLESLIMSAGRDLEGAAASRSDYFAHHAAMHSFQAARLLEEIAKGSLSDAALGRVNSEVTAMNDALFGPLPDPPTWIEENWNPS